MGLKCLLGHDFSEAEIEREREEDGDQMVVTIREVKTCQRCGVEQVISENKEVTSIRSPDELGLDTESEAAAGTEPGSAEVTGDVDPEQEATGTGDRPDASERPDAGDRPDADEAEVLDAGAETDPAGATVDAERPDDEQVTAVEEDPESDDGVILPEEDQQRDHGEWPDAEQVGDRATARGADRNGDDEGAAVGGAAESPVEGAEPPDEDVAAGSDRAGAEPQQTDEDGQSGVDEPTVAAGESEDVEIIGDSDDAEAADAPGAVEDDGQRATAVEGNAGAESAEGGSDPLASDDDATAWPDHGGEDEGFDAEVGGEDDVSFSGNTLTPEVDAEAPQSDAEYVDSDAEGRGANEFEDRTPRADVDTGIASEGSTSIDLSEIDDEVKFYCPNCGLARRAGESSMRAGDICPECRKGYIAEHEG
jgi:predicted RNA-binding Zn-ribbon protein involved in translation (DUF1610 family)